MTNSDALTFTLDPTTDTASAVCVAFTIPHEAWQSAGRRGGRRGRRHLPVPG